MKAADIFIDIGPEAGTGGELVAQGTYRLKESEFINSKIFEWKERNISSKNRRKFQNHIEVIGQKIT